MSLPSSPACSSASRAAGSAMSVSASSSAAMRRSRMPVRSMIHSSDVSTSVDSSSFVSTRSGTCTPRPVMPTLRPFATPIMRSTCASCTANVSVPRTASSPSTVARALPRPIGPRTVSSVHSSVSSSPGRTMRLKRTSSMPAKSASRPRFSSSESTATAPACASASTIFTPGMIGLPGKWPAQSSSVTRLRATTRAPGSSSTTSSSEEERAAGAGGSLRLSPDRRGRHGQGRLV